MESLIISLLSGALGGNLAGKAMPNNSLGTLWNSVAGIAGGGIGSQVLGALGVAASSGSLDLTSILTSVAGGGVGGGVLMALIGIVKKAMAK